MSAEPDHRTKAEKRPWWILSWVSSRVYLEY